MRLNSGAGDLLFVIQTSVQVVADLANPQADGLAEDKSQPTYSEQTLPGGTSGKMIEHNTGRNAECRIEK